MNDSLRFVKAGIPRVLAWVSAFLEQIKDDKEYVIECKEYRKKRSLNANAYYWMLINEIANRTPNVTKNSVHFEMLRGYGQREVVSVRSDINIAGYFKYYEECGKGTVNGVEFTHYTVFKPSSEMDSREMFVLIEGTVYEAQQLGIETRTPAEIRSICESREHEKHNTAE